MLSGSPHAVPASSRGLASGSDGASMPRAYGYMNTIIRSFAGAVVLLSGAGMVSLQAQEPQRISLEQAIAEARANHPQVGIAEARATGAREQVGVAAASRWPSLGVEAGAARSTDPVAAFGGRLRQARFTEEDFAPARLNNPAALTDWDAAVTVGWVPVDFSRDAGVRAARAEAESAQRTAEWTQRVVAYQAEVRWVEAVGAELLLETARAAVRAAEADLFVATRREEEGMVTRSDVLQVSAALESSRAQEIMAEQGVADARGRLALALGWAPDREPVPDTQGLALPPGPAEERTAGERADLLASEQRVRAATASARQADNARLPQLQGFARVEAHSADPFGHDGDSWTVGFRVSLPLFSGFETSARRGAAQAALAAANLEHTEMLRESRAELDETRRGAEAARRAAIAAERASESAEEAARLMRRRFEEGLATTAELLGAQAAAVRFAGAAVEALLDHRVVAARLLLLDDAQLQSNSVEGDDR